jgi:uncharacterized membrane protein YcgQ (UPF0703/DUF1980 family)
VKFVSVGLAGAFAYVMLEMTLKDRLKYYLNTDLFATVVYVAGSLLAVLVLLRPVVWLLAQAGLVDKSALAAGCCHDHGHGDEHGHDHHHEVASWKLIVLTFPLMLLLAGLVPTSLSAEAIANKLAQQAKLAAGMNVAALPAERKAAYADPSKVETVQATMKELAEAARNPAQREYWESTKEPRAAEVVGQFFPLGGSSDKYQITRLKMTCCANDATPMTVIVMGQPESGWEPGGWVQIFGPVSYQADKTGTYTPILFQLAGAKLKRPPSDIMLK